FGLAENTYDLFVGKTLLHGDVLMWLMKTLLTSRCINQRGAGHMNSDIVLNIRHKKAAPGAAYAFFLKEKVTFSSLWRLAGR
ncbi:hypothetical protein, partial [Klebsiella pneumoniae]|uniref:hypothetical protein n=1 Tax=Klebsiella pneumoniae TaxID=573 RepID=UPI003754CAE0